MEKNKRYPLWELKNSNSPLIAVALHNGHFISPQLLNLSALDDLERLREEDPYTGSWTSMAPTSIVVNRSRFEVDLNRPRLRAVYQSPEDAWGLNLWKQPLPLPMVQSALTFYDDFYAQMELIFNQAQAQWGQFVVLDLHSYNGRRGGANAPLDSQALNPEINIGTGTMDRQRWAGLIDPFIHDLAQFNFFGRNLDVRENVKFFGGELARWAHQKYPDSACVLSVEVKKFFMNEWTGQVDQLYLDMVGSALASTIPALMHNLEVVRRPLPIAI
ncbi:MAG: N-formylglutamate amidohydrolase [Magnetococcales bacterium]|nr:N-formylglutamate amidohydrolase [Magnetococcales bacterium]